MRVDAAISAGRRRCVESAAQLTHRLEHQSRALVARDHFVLQRHHLRRLALQRPVGQREPQLQLAITVDNADLLAPNIANSTLVPVGRSEMVCFHASPSLRARETRAIRTCAAGAPRCRLVERTHCHGEPSRRIVPVYTSSVTPRSSSCSLPSIGLSFFCNCTFATTSALLRDLRDILEADLFAEPGERLRRTELELPEQIPRPCLRGKKQEHDDRERDRDDGDKPRQPAHRACQITLILPQRRRIGLDLGTQIALAGLSSRPSGETAGSSKARETGTR